MGVMGYGVIDQDGLPGHLILAPTPDFAEQMYEPSSSITEIRIIKDYKENNRVNANIVGEVSIVIQSSR